MDQTWTARVGATALAGDGDSSGLGHPRLALFDRIRAILVTTGLPPDTPVFDLLLRHVEGDDPVLSAAVAAALALGTLDLATVDALRQAYCGDQPAGEVAALVEAAHSQAEALGARLSAGADDLATYGTALAAGEVALGAAEPPSATALVHLIERLGAATATMIAANARLNHELADAAHETGRLHERLRAAETAAVTDPLTGVLNRRGALKRLEAAQAAASAAASALSIAMVDIDHFKRVNDRYGHVMGDEVLRYVAQHLSQSVAPAGIVGRLGGEEFRRAARDAPRRRDGYRRPRARQSRGADHPAQRRRQQHGPHQLFGRHRAGADRRGRHGDHRARRHGAVHRQAHGPRPRRACRLRKGEVVEGVGFEPT